VPNKTNHRPHDVHDPHTLRVPDLFQYDDSGFQYDDSGADKAEEEGCDRKNAKPIWMHGQT
jgi:hypothetical protein